MDSVARPQNAEFESANTNGKEDANPRVDEEATLVKHSKGIDTLIWLRGKSVPH